MWKTYKYIYYWLYTWTRDRKHWSNKNAPEFTGLFGITLSFIFIILIINLISYVITGSQLIIQEIPKEYLLPIVIVILLIHYFLLVHKGKYKEIEKEFKGESKEERKRKGFWVLMYSFGSIGLFIFLMFFGIWLRKNGYTPES